MSSLSAGKPTRVVSECCWWLAKGLGGVRPRYGRRRKPLNVLTIQKGHVHRNRSLLGMSPSFVWKTRTGCPMARELSNERPCPSTKALRRHWPCSKCAKLAMCCSRSSSNCSSRCCSDSVSGSCSTIYTCQLGIWNSIGITASNPNESREGVEPILVLNVVRYAQRALWSLSSQSMQFSFTIFLRMVCKVLFVDSTSLLA